MWGKKFFTQKIFRRQEKFWRQELYSVEYFFSAPIKNAMAANGKTGTNYRIQNGPLLESASHYQNQFPSLRYSVIDHGVNTIPLKKAWQKTYIDVCRQWQTKYCITL